MFIKGLGLLVLLLVAVALVVWGTYTLVHFIWSRWVSDEARVTRELEEATERLKKELKN